MNSNWNHQLIKKGITGISILVPLLVIVLYIMPKGRGGESFNYSILPAINATINGLTTAVLLLAFLAIRKKKINLHRNLMLFSLLLSTLFLISYVIYHFNVPSKPFGGEGLIRGFYFFILITHIILATIIVPLALVTLYRGLTNSIIKHKRIARFTLPIWLYVSITGVLVYLLMQPYY